MKRYINGLIAIMGILAVSVLLLQPGNAVTNNTTAAQASATVRETISVTLSLSDAGGGVTFGNLDAGTNNNSASNNLNISIDVGTNVATNISQNATAFSGPDSLAIGNLRYSNASGSPGLTNSTAMTTSFPASPFTNWVNIAKPTGSSTYRDVFYWLTIPSAQTAGTYTTNIYVNVTAYQ